MTMKIEPRTKKRPCILICHLAQVPQPMLRHGEDAHEGGAGRDYRVGEAGTELIGQGRPVCRETPMMSDSGREDGHGERGLAGVRGHEEVEDGLEDDT